MKSEIIAVGSEMLTPVRQDTNSLYLTEKLNEIGVTVAFKTIVGDRQKDLVSAIRIAMPQNNLKQADVLEGATLLPNPNGSAPGQWLDTTFDNFRKLVMLVPGPPNECIAMFDAECLPRLRAALPTRFIAKRTLKAAMIPESQADKLAAPIYTTYTDVETTILAKTGDIQLTLLCTKNSLEDAQRRVDELAGKLEEVLEEWLYSSEGESLEQTVLDYLGFRNATLAVAESCTGGMLAQRITAVSGSSRSFLGGAVVYSNEMKTLLAGVDPALIERHGAVSQEVARALADGIRQRTGSTIGVGVTGIAGPTGGTETKPVGLVYIAVSDAQKTDCLERNFRGARDRIREWTTSQALDLIRRRLM